MLIQLYSALKAGWSRFNDLIMAGAPRRPIPVFPSPLEAARYLLARVVYVPDPLGGAADWSVHPERLQAALEAGPEAVKRIPGVDCDDWATWAYAALAKIPGCKPQILTLLDAGLVGSHVICGYELAGRYGVIDTNGHRFMGDLKAKTLCDVWSAIYRERGYRYISAEPTPYPF